MPTDVTSTRSAFSPACKVAVTVVVIPDVTLAVCPFRLAKLSAISLSGVAIEPVTITFNSAAPAEAPNSSAATIATIPPCFTWNSMPDRLETRIHHHVVRVRALHRGQAARALPPDWRSPTPIAPA